jgi:hypothetical protein
MTLLYCAALIPFAIMLMYNLIHNENLARLLLNTIIYGTVFLGAIWGLQGLLA